MATCLFAEVKPAHRQAGWNTLVVRLAGAGE